MPAAAAIMFRFFQKTQTASLHGPCPSGPSSSSLGHSWIVGGFKPNAVVALLICVRWILPLSLSPMTHGLFNQGATNSSIENLSENFWQSLKHRFTI